MSSRAECVLALPSVRRALTQSPPRVFDVGTRLCLPVCVRACMRGRSYATISGGRSNIASYKWVPLPIVSTYCFAQE
jgi:hypothetical protein